ncbi:uncharacterized protein A4U43_C06F1830 [Asparagus officinalis]|uniref:Uncharacterized protein n=1 Tax=Asparagus officinalis TaxID=4686 RepID=A0A5P1EMU0_ASPOF|nr:uncharacterized protein A4U43_C06F1830 [Asparagus officinalis]
MMFVIRHGDPTSFPFPDRRINPPPPPPRSGQESRPFAAEPAGRDSARKAGKQKTPARSTGRLPNPLPNIHQAIIGGAGCTSPTSSGISPLRQLGVRVLDAVCSTSRRVISCCLRLAAGRSTTVVASHAEAAHEEIMENAATSACWLTAPHLSRPPSCATATPGHLGLRAPKGGLTGAR